MLNNLNSDVTKPNTSIPTDTDKIEERIEDVQNQVNDLKDEVDKVDIEKRNITAQGIVTENLITNTIKSNTSTTEHLEAKSADIDNISTTHIDNASIDTLSVQNKIDDLKVGTLQTDSLDTNSISTAEFGAVSIDTRNLNADEITNKTITTESIFSEGARIAAIDADNLYVKEVMGNQIDANQIHSGIIEATNLSVTEEVQAEFANFINSTVQKLSTEETVLNNTINLDPALQTPGDWYAITIPDYSMAQIFLHYKWVDGDNNISITKSGNTAFIQYDISNRNAIKSISWRREDGSIKIHIRAEGELQYHITHLQEDVEREITSESNGDEYEDYIFVPTKLHTYLFKGFAFNDYSLEAPLLARFSILEADEEQFELLSTNILAINDAIRLPTDWDDLGNVVGRSDGEDKQIIRMRTKNDVTKPTYEDTVDNTEVTPLQYDDKLVTQETVANYDGTVLDEDSNNVYPITNLGNNTITHGGHEIVGDLNVRGEVTAHTIDVDEDVTIRGDLYVEGKTTTTVETQVATSGDYLVTRENNPTVLGENERSGIVINNYNTDENGNSKAASITVDKNGVVGVSANTTINNTTFTDISFYNNKYYEGLTDTESTATLDIITSEEGDEKEDAVFYDGNYYYWTGEDWRGPIQYTDDKGLYGDVVEEPALESLDKHTLVYYKSVTTQSINPEDVEALATREDNMDDKYYPIYSKDDEQLQTSTSCIYEDADKNTHIKVTGGDVSINDDNGIEITSNTNTPYVSLVQSTHHNCHLEGSRIESTTKKNNGNELTTCLIFPTGTEGQYSDYGVNGYNGIANLVLKNNENNDGSMIPVVTALSPSMLGMDHNTTHTYKEVLSKLGVCGVPQGTLTLNGKENDVFYAITGLQVGTLQINGHPVEAKGITIEWYGNAERFTGEDTASDWMSVTYKIRNSNGMEEMVIANTQGGGTPVTWTEKLLEASTAITDTCLTSNILVSSGAGVCRATNANISAGVYSTADSNHDQGTGCYLNLTAGPIPAYYNFPGTVYVGANICAGAASGVNNVIVGSDASISPSSSYFCNTMIGARHCMNGSSLYCNVLVGTCNCVSGGNNNVLVGTQACSFNSFVVGIGPQVSINAVCSVGIGYLACTNASTAVAIGTYAHGMNVASVAVGNRACATGDFSISIGCFSCTVNDNTIALGCRACALSSKSISIGWCATTTTAVCSIAIGACSCTGSAFEVAIGACTRICGQNATVLGSLSCANGNQVIIGSKICGVRSDVFNPVIVIAANPSNFWLGDSQHACARTVKAVIQVASGISYCTLYQCMRNFFYYVSGHMDCTWRGMGKTQVTRVSDAANGVWDDRLLIDYKGNCSNSCLYFSGNWYSGASSNGPWPGCSFMMDFTAWNVTI